MAKCGIIYYGDNMNAGKKFEQIFKKSIPNDSNVYYYRLKDGTASWNTNQDNVRFQSSNIADSFLFAYGKLFIIELKSHKGKSIPLNCIRNSQVNGLLEASLKNDVLPFIIIYFSDVQQCFALSIENYQLFTHSFDRKSIPISFCQSNGIPIKVIPKRTSFSLDIESFIELFI